MSTFESPLEADIFAEVDDAYTEAMSAQAEAEAEVAFNAWKADREAEGDPELDTDVEAWIADMLGPLDGEDDY